MLCFGARWINFCTGSYSFFIWEIQDQIWLPHSSAIGCPDYVPALPPSWAPSVLPQGWPSSSWIPSCLCPAPSQPFHLFSQLICITFSITCKLVLLNSSGLTLTSHWSSFLNYFHYYLSLQSFFLSYLCCFFFQTGFGVAQPGFPAVCLVGVEGLRPYCILLSAWVLSHFSHVQLFATLWTVARQAPLTIGFSRQEYWSGLPCPPPEGLPDSGTESTSAVSPELQANSLLTEPPAKKKKKKKKRQILSLCTT